MLLRPARLRRLAALCAIVLLAAVALLARPALAFPPAGIDTLPVSGQVSVTSLIGTEDIPLTGTATFQRGAAQLQGGVEVVPTEIIALALTGTSVTGPISVAESNTLASAGELRALQPVDSYPASSFFDVYVTVTAPASTGTPTVTSIVLHNSTPLRMVASDRLSEWPPVSAIYSAAPDPCVPLLPALPKRVCITGLTFKISGGIATVGGLTTLPDIAAGAEREQDASRRGTAGGIAMGLAGLAAAGVGWWVKRSLGARR